MNFDFISLGFISTRANEICVSTLFGGFAWRFVSSPSSLFNFLQVPLQIREGGEGEGENFNDPFSQRLHTIASLP